MTVTDEMAEAFKIVMRARNCPIPWEPYLREALEAVERVRPQPQSSPREVGEGDIKALYDIVYDQWFEWTHESVALEAWEPALRKGLSAVFALHPVPLAQSVRPASDTAREVLVEALVVAGFENERWVAGTEADVATQGIINWIRHKLAALPQSPPSWVDEGWRPIATAPKDGSKILVWHDHGSDPYFEDKSSKCTPYGAWAEGNGYEKESGIYIAVWGGGYAENETDGWGPDTIMPDWWFKHDSELEQPLAPVYWAPLLSNPSATNEESGT